MLHVLTDFGVCLLVELDVFVLVWFGRVREECKWKMSIGDTAWPGGWLGANDVDLTLLLLHHLRR